MTLDRRPQIDGSPAASLRTGEVLADRYLIARLLAQGGMGEVYQARDRRLSREVAVKVLLSSAENDPDRLRRLEQEARAAGGLNHPNVLTVYDVGTHEGAPYVVSELLEGATLREKLAAGPLPIGKALDFAIQIARGLAVTHDTGIVHRDLKPENVFVTRDGRVKILDFGLAKHVQTAPLEDRATASWREGGTQPGTILGTKGYMSPEQVRGTPADHRSDIFSFGAVLYEMLVGQRAFRGETAADTLTEILTRDPPEIPTTSGATPACMAIVRRCLEKDPDARFRSAHDLGFALETLSGATAPSGPRAATEGPSKERRRSWLDAMAPVVPWVVAAVAMVAATVAVRRSPTAPAATTKRFIVELSGVERLHTGGRSIAFIPDGSGLAYAGGHGNDWRIHLHTFGDGVSRPVSGTEGASEPFLSPDGKWLGFFQGGKLKKTAVGGGPPTAICDAPSGSRGGGASWGPDEQIVFGGERGLWRVPAAGGEPEAVTTTDRARGEGRHRDPHIFAGGKAVLFTVLSTTGAMEDAKIAVVSLPSRERHILVKGGASARYASTGHLVYVRGTDLLTVPFDPDRLSVSGSASVAVADVLITPQYLYGQFDLSADGTLAYIPSGSALERTLVWVDRRGNVRPLPLPPRGYTHLSLLPGDRGVIVEIEDTPHNIWHGDLQSGALTRLTSDGANHRPVLSPDGRWMAFGSDRVVTRSLFRQATDGSGTAERLLEAPHSHNPLSWSSDGRWLAFAEVHPQSRDDIWILPLEGDRRPRPFLKTPFSEHSAAFSPDGRWLAYASDESGRSEVLIAAFPGPGPRRKVSTNGGGTPLFSRDGRELFYRLGNQVMAAEIVTQPTLTSGVPRVAFDFPEAAIVATSLPNFAVNAAGDSILTLRAVESESGPPRAHVVINWFEELRRRAATK